MQQLECAGGFEQGFVVDLQLAGVQLRLNVDLRSKVPGALRLNGLRRIEQLFRRIGAEAK